MPAINSLSETNFSEKLVSKKINHDLKEKYIEKKNKQIDDNILNKIDDDEIDPLVDVNIDDDYDLLDDNIGPPPP